MCLQISQKEIKENTNFDELPKRNYRIKITKIKIIRFETKVLNFTFWNLNQEVFGYLQKFENAKNKRFYAYYIAYIQ